ncbi:hypothetical protein D3C77_465550 [compost metagenome]
MTNLALAQQIAHGGDGNLQRRVVVFAVQVIDIQVVGAQAGQAGLDGIEDMLAVQARAVRDTLGGTEADLAGQHPVMAVARDRLTDDFLAVPGVVDIGGVDEVDALVPGLVDDQQGIFGAGLFAEHHAAQGQGGYLQAAAAQWTVDHERVSLGGLDALCCTQFPAGSKAQSAEPVGAGLPRDKAGTDSYQRIGCTGLSRGKPAPTVSVLVRPRR